MHSAQPQATQAPGADLITCMGNAGVTMETTLEAAGDSGLAMWMSVCECKTGPDPVPHRRPGMGEATAA